MKEFYSKNAEYPESEGAFPLLIIFDLLVRDNHCQLLYQIPSTMPLDRGTLRNNFDSRSTVPYLSNKGASSLHGFCHDDGGSVSSAFIDSSWAPSMDFALLHTSGAPAEWSDLCRISHELLLRLLPVLARTSLLTVEMRFELRSSAEARICEVEAAATALSTAHNVPLLRFRLFAAIYLFQAQVLLVALYLRNSGALILPGMPKIVSAVSASSPCVGQQLPVNKCHGVRDTYGVNTASDCLYDVSPELSTDDGLVSHFPGVAPSGIQDASCCTSDCLRTISTRLAKAPRTPCSPIAPSVRRRLGYDRPVSLSPFAWLADVCGSSVRACDVFPDRCDEFPCVPLPSLSAASVLHRSCSPSRVCSYSMMARAGWQRRVRGCAGWIYWDVLGGSGFGCCSYL